MGFFDKIKNGLKKTKDSMIRRVETVIHSFTKIDEDFFEELEETLILCDIGVQTSVKICDELRSRIKKTGATDPAVIKDMLKEIISEMMSGSDEMHISTKPSVILMIGVNGVGKTTTIGKLAANYKAQGKKVILGAADTFRAAAADQLGIWAERAGVDMIRHAEGADPAAVVYDTIKAGQARGADLIICDTAGRLHNKKNLMDELAKISRVIDREAGDCDREILLVIDATTGQNGVNQAREFKETAGITGIVLTKLDGTAKGGIVIAIKDELGLPVKFVGVGEKIDDLQPFVAQDFVNALFD
ncbi:signal recognition particle-docking protein FtsY [Phocea massiliensis]|uniref:Signal recognition particle receptor FtsY n=1 Tax=Merdimmobilis hominis TaxID=2897707 RepID=A0A938X7J7_9FIRM|nr:signal recognition particle-docking protein FtsY [Merdimmobilis hominis]MBM6920595.1 signal recognition particle-docking protein FtsY [Merdimmobilis hominis]